jgi:hypothetical protein
MISSIGVAGCTGFGDNLEIVEERYTYSEPEAYGTWTVTVENTGEATNVLAYVDLIGVNGEDEGEVLESYDRTGIIEEAEEKTISVTNAHYLRRGVDYEFSRGIERTDRPHSDFDIREGTDEEVLLDATSSGSVESSIVSYEWTAEEFEYVGSGEPLEWGIPDGEVVEITPPDPKDFFANIGLTITDGEGRTDTYRESISNRHTE